ncbi:MULTISPECIES: winged helix-turn-helix transcriptional regulator [Romboutsia]|uniref:HxlR-type HTH domain profile n=1 Tax=Romboutsia hominis TaxID=1507512 RepID=A0A2P2BNY2_9FIRM|nr:MULTISPECIES: helix-turn-helix domain-containing protein [Romboutsia]MCH1959266.1 helix-turn-helix transcriptional regulator [Romboutsia hominis]MCH1970164.1 helix-turn-helix transcriptional regulator [Romboutsia hominis]MDB8790164.1 helix-turn-helix domain-containing protein [Romboutsia sp. 1001216sp1]MDB8792195.1 helix-turn-helix domain-containing protein [Romboutsia sp. 1001216sp1]MDB8797162.1 helix-turn-helix domain-containing protein [Romboutsia sp. 1001216sp1]
MYNISDMVYDCPVEALASILGKKWVGGIIWAIQDDKVRFGDLQRKMNKCSKKMLIQQLDLLIENNIIINDKKLIKNTVESTYYLSESGLALLNVMAKMIEWSNQHITCEE